MARIVWNSEHGWHDGPEVRAYVDQGRIKTRAYCTPPFLASGPCKAGNICRGHEGCVGFSDCPCGRCRNDRMKAMASADPKIAAMLDD